MAPFHKRNCPHCQKQNVFDQAQLDRDTMDVFRGIDDESETIREYQVHCQVCNKPFVIGVRTADEHPGL